jgi:hypothetical protein
VPADLSLDVKPALESRPTDGRDSRQAVRLTSKERREGLERSIEVEPFIIPVRRINRQCHERRLGRRSAKLSGSGVDREIRTSTCANFEKVLRLPGGTKCGVSSQRAGRPGHGLGVGIAGPSRPVDCELIDLGGERTEPRSHCACTRNRNRRTTSRRKGPEANPDGDQHAERRDENRAHPVEGNGLHSTPLSQTTEETTSRLQREGPHIELAPHEEAGCSHSAALS